MSWHCFVTTSYWSFSYFYTMSTDFKWLLLGFLCHQWDFYVLPEFVVIFWYLYLYVTPVICWYFSYVFWFYVWLFKDAIQIPKHLSGFSYIMKNKFVLKEEMVLFLKKILWKLKSQPLTVSPGPWARAYSRFRTSVFSFCTWSLLAYTMSFGGLVCIISS